MPKYHGVIGFGDTQEIAPGVWDDAIVERQYYGDILTNSRRLDDSSSVSGELSVSNSISILADAYLNGHFFAIRYVEWAGAFWVVENVTVERPRLILRLGGVYHGPTVASSSTP